MQSVLISRLLADNAVLRAMGNPDTPGVVAAYDANFGGQDVRGCFTTTRASPSLVSLDYAEVLVRARFKVNTSHS